MRPSTAAFGTVATMKVSEPGWNVAFTPPKVSLLISPRSLQIPILRQDNFKLHHYPSVGVICVEGIDFCRQRLRFF
jgi:hypothetical protein